MLHDGPISHGYRSGRSRPDSAAPTVADPRRYGGGGGRGRTPTGSRHRVVAGVELPRADHAPTVSQPVDAQVEPSLSREHVEYRWAELGEAVHLLRCTSNRESVRCVHDLLTETQSSQERPGAETNVAGQQGPTEGPAVVLGHQVTWTVISWLTQLM
jgi:hypothetical protein